MSSSAELFAQLVRYPPQKKTSDNNENVSTGKQTEKKQKAINGNDDNKNTMDINTNPME